TAVPGLRRGAAAVRPGPHHHRPGPGCRRDLPALFGMTGRPGGEDGRAATPGGTGSAGAGPAEGRPAAQVLADRVAAALVRHEPGWRLPRRSALARRYGVSPAEMAAAIEELSARRL